jgi:hypothetical protein
MRFYIIPQYINIYKYISQSSWRLLIWAVLTFGFCYGYRLCSLWGGNWGVLKIKKWIFCLCFTGFITALLRPKLSNSLIFSGFIRQSLAGQPFRSDAITGESLLRVSVLRRSHAFSSDRFFRYSRDKWTNVHIAHMMMSLQFAFKLDGR